MAICNALAAVESQEITAALNQMPPCPSRMQPKIQKVRAGGGAKGGEKKKKNNTSKPSSLPSHCPTWKIPK